MPFIAYEGTRILFIHIPKTGGTSVESWLRTLGELHFHSAGLPAATRCTPQHFRMQDMRALFGVGFFDYAFTIVRNPYDRVASEYRMQASLQGKGFFKNRTSFSMWLEENLRRQTRDPFHLDNHLRPQWEFVGSATSVFRLEDGLDKALQPLAERIGVAAPRDLPRELSTAGSLDKVVWDRFDRLLVQDHYRKDFEEFGYDVHATEPVT